MSTLPLILNKRKTDNGTNKPVVIWMTDNAVIDTQVPEGVELIIFIYGIDGIYDEPVVRSFTKDGEVR